MNYTLHPEGLQQSDASLPLSQKAWRVLHRGSSLGEAYAVSGIVPDFFNAKSTTERFDILERETRRKSVRQGVPAVARAVPDKAATEVYIRRTLSRPEYWKGAEGEITPPAYTPAEMLEWGPHGTGAPHAVRTGLPSHAEEINARMGIKPGSTNPTSGENIKYGSLSTDDLIRSTHEPFATDIYTEEASGHYNRREAPSWAETGGYNGNYDAMMASASRRSAYRAADLQVGMVEQTVTDFTNKSVTGEHHLPSTINHYNHLAISRSQKPEAWLLPKVGSVGKLHVSLNPK